MCKVYHIWLFEGDYKCMGYWAENNVSFPFAGFTCMKSCVGHKECVVM